MRIIIGCEISGKVRDAFYRRGHDVWSCDLRYSDHPRHIQDDILDWIDEHWDMGVFFPPCTHLCVSGARWFKDKQREQQKAINFVQQLWDAPIDKICVENPVGVLSTKSTLGKATQYIQPWEYGHGETKKTGLWLKGLPKLVPTDIVEGRENRIHKLPPSKDRGMLRGITYQGIADAMADQWG